MATAPKIELQTRCAVYQFILAPAQSAYSYTPMRRRETKPFFRAHIDTHNVGSFCYRLCVLFVIFSSMSIRGVYLTSINATILQAPKSVNISENEEIFFHCTVIGDYINWIVNDTPVQDLAAGLGFDDSYLPQIITRNNSTNERIAKLKIQGSLYSNNTNITCQVTQVQEELTSGVFRITTAKSKPALILVQGLLDSVTNLSVSIDRNEGKSAMITWTPPYTLMNVPILSYTVSVDVGRSLRMNVNVPNTSTFLTQWANPESFNDFHVAVRPVNRVGQGKIAATTTTVLPVTFATTGMPQINFQGDVQYSTKIIISVMVIIATAAVTSNLILIAIVLALYRKNINLQKKMTYIPKT